MRVGSYKMAIFGSFRHCLPNILRTWPHDSFQVIRLSMTLGIFQGHCTVSHRISQKRCVDIFIHHLGGRNKQKKNSDNNNNKMEEGSNITNLTNFQ